MKILIASDSFKGSLSSQDVAFALEKGILSVLPDSEIETVAMADGGEGSLDAINQSIHANEVSQFVKDPFWRTIAASYLRKGKTAYIEMAAASGLHLIKESQRNPEYATSYGTGQQIKHAVKNGAEEIFLFVGGTATNDGGMGMAQSLGYKFLDINEGEVLAVGESLIQIKKILPPANPLSFKLKIVCDVTNPMFGPNGAAYVFGAQKGANEEAIERLDKGLRNLAEIIKNELGKDVSEIPGGGAAGGVPAGMNAFFDAEILPGTETIMRIIGLRDRIEKADLIITGEGKLDHQTLSGKLISGIAKSAKQFEIPIFGVCGINELSLVELKHLGILKVYPLVNGNVTKAEAIKNSNTHLENIGKEIGLMIKNEGLKILK